MTSPRHAALVGAALAAAVIAGCGGSSKPAYCTTRSNLEQAVKNLPDSVRTGGTSGLQAQLTTIENEAKTLVSQAKSDFPNETTALSSSIDQLKAAVKALPSSSPSATDIAAVVLDATAVVNSVQSFTSATQSSC
jgi:hypothetical protein